LGTCNKEGAYRGVRGDHRGPEFDNIACGIEAETAVRAATLFTVKVTGTNGPVRTWLVGSAITTGIWRKI
jgi:hypothetical protein